MKILIIGGQGYIGTELVDYFVNEFAGAKIVVVDTEDYTSISLAKSKSVDYIIARYQDLDASFYSIAVPVRA